MKSQIDDVCSCIYGGGGGGGGAGVLISIKYFVVSFFFLPCSSGWLVGWLVG